ncbi:putative major facilitator, sugar transporter, major facilitator superfamily [Helianthus annuus]|nr:putative major facilitator, sugar transporter, major facilitator superfamily [Helianthus annuus]KAJ0849657.1 putative major facilitator, sugar transporter, major facilitator superfamily [Helianthus annuus]KAJ0858693.1 putative major facilitator, sugar transporter, major facilitator superfamily [Helianthus annuus]
MTTNTPTLSLPDDLRSPLIPPDDKNRLDGHHEPPVERLCIDVMLRKYCGEFGYWQFKHFVLTSMAWALEAFHTMVMIFADREPDWSCEPGSDCVVTSDVCALQPGTWRWDGGSGMSTVAEWGLVCGQKYKVGLVQSLFFGGCMIGAGIFGHLSDSKLGRKGSLTVVCILNALFGLLTSLSPNYLTYVLLRLLTGFSTGGVGLCAFVLATEPVGPSKRGIAGMSTFYFFSSGIALLSGIAYVFQTWRSLYIASSVPSILFVFLILPFISESPRWYLIRGQTDNAMSIMRAIAATNGRCIPENVYVARDEEVKDNDQKSFEARSKEVITGSVVDALKSPLTRIRLILVVGINFTCSVVYYGLSLNVVNLETNLYVSVLVNAVAEMPAFFLTAVLIDRFGRKPLGVGTQWFSGIFCIAGSFMGNEGAWKVIRMLCGVLGIFGMAGTYNLLFIYAMELFPTVVRNAALGCATQAAQLGAILAPFVVVMGGGIPFLVFGVCGIVGGLLTFYLPETLNKPLYDTMDGMADGENEA